MESHMSSTQANWVIVLLVVLIGLSGFNTLGARLGVASGWEYRLDSPPDVLFQSELDKLGKEGWELVFARRATGSSKSASYEMIFRRPRGR